MIRESIYFRPRETGFRFFRDPRNMHLLSRDFFTFLKLLGSLKLVNYTKLGRCKTCPFDAGACGWRTEN